MKISKVIVFVILAAFSLDASTIYPGAIMCKTEESIRHLVKLSPLGD
jgi:hypothetical protein